MLAFRLGFSVRDSAKVRIRVTVSVRVRMLVLVLGFTIPVVIA